MDPAWIIYGSGRHHLASAELASDRYQLAKTRDGCVASRDVSVRHESPRLACTRGLFMRAHADYVPVALRANASLLWRSPSPFENSQLAIINKPIWGCQTCALPVFYQREPRPSTE